MQSCNEKKYIDNNTYFSLALIVVRAMGIYDLRHM